MSRGATYSTTCKTRLSTVVTKAQNLTTNSGDTKRTNGSYRASVCRAPSLPSTSTPTQTVRRSPCALLYLILLLVTHSNACYCTILRDDLIRVIKIRPTKRDFFLKLFCHKSISYSEYDQEYPSQRTFFFLSFRIPFAERIRDTLNQSITTNSFGW